jgi:Flp pilus assembly protein TadG
MHTQRLRGLFKRFAWRDNGAASMEVIILTPVFLILFGMVTDVSIVFGRQAEILRIIQDSNRSLAVGKFQTIAEAEQYVSEKVSIFSDESSVEVAVTGGIIQTAVTLPASDLTSTGLFEAIDSLTLTIGASQMSEL